MQELLTLTTGTTHLYRGARLTLRNASTPPDESSEVVVVFRDHVAVEAVLTPSGDAFILQVADYMTTARTKVNARSWRLVPANDGAFTVKSRTDSAIVDDPKPAG